MKTIACCLLFAALFVPSLKAEDKVASASGTSNSPVLNFGESTDGSKSPVVTILAQDEDTCQVSTPITSTQNAPKKYCCVYLFGAVCACESTGLDQCLVDCADWY